MTLSFDKNDILNNINKSNSFEESIDLACQALRKQIIKNKNK